MRVNGREVLACVCMLAEYGDEITVEPLANFPVRSDVVVDMESFYERFPDKRPIIRVSEMPAAARPPEDLKAFVRLEDCIECGLCSSACPVASTDDRFVGPAALVAAARLIEEPRDHDPEDLRAWISRAEGVWQCTTCMACAAACPASIEHVPLIIDMRRELVERGEIDPLLQETLEKLVRQGNSYGKSGRMRARWTKALDFTIPDARKEAVDYLWFLGDFAAFDERVQDASRRLAAILHDAGVSFGLLYEGERNAGNDVRAVGEQGLFEMLVAQNMGALHEAEFKTIFTTDPHSLNALRNDYPRYGLEQPVLHYSELLARLASDGVIDPRPALQGARVTYHDPCYLARYNDITEAPRSLIKLTGAELVEMPRHGASTFCCGAGGGRIWMSESDVEERPSEQRIREALSLGGLDYFVVSCPKDLVMYSAAAEAVGGVDFEIVELAALLERALS
jgi:succinate dehydrogenase/fumarate reductase iron-sulfur protein